MNDLRKWGWRFFGKGNHFDTKDIDKRFPNARKFPPTIYGGKDALKAFGRSGDEAMMSQFSHWTQWPRPKWPAEWFEAWRFWRAVKYAIGEAMSTDGLQFGSEYNHNWYGFGSVADVKASQKNIIPTAAYNVSTITDYGNAVVDLAKTGIWEDLKYWGFGTPQLYAGRCRGKDHPLIYVPNPNNYSKTWWGHLKFPRYEFVLSNQPTETNTADDAHLETQGGRWVAGKQLGHDDRPLIRVFLGNDNGPPAVGGGCPGRSQLLDTGTIDRELAALFLVFGWWAKYGSSQTRAIKIRHSDGEVLFDNWDGVLGGTYRGTEGTIHVSGTQMSINVIERAVEAKMHATENGRITAEDVAAVRDFVKIQLLGDKATAEWLDSFPFLGEDRDWTPPVEKPKAVPKVKLKKGASAWDQQCFLVENMKRISAAAGRRSYSDFGILDGAPGNIVSALHKGPFEDDSAMHMLNLSPSVYAHMVPYMKLYRVVYDKDDPSGAPIGEDPMPFESFTKREDIDNIFEGRESRQAGAGVKSFEWKLDGVQPEEVDNNISATLEVHFQSMYDLFRHNIDPSQTTSDDVSSQAGLEKPGFLDLIIAPETKTGLLSESPPENPPPATGGCDAASKIYEGALYRIKIVVGWSVPDGLENIPNVKNPEALAEAIEQQRKTLFLQLARHSIDFQQDGTVKLRVEYQAALDGILRSSFSDIFSGEEELKDIFEDPDGEAAQLRADYRDRSITAEDKKIFEEYLDQQISLEREDRLIKYRRVLKQLYESGNINRIRVPMKSLLRKPWRDLTPVERAKRARNQQSDDPRKAGFQITVAGATEDASPLYTILEDAENGDAALGKDGIARIGSSLNTIKNATPADNVDIHYFYLGDLITSVLELPQIVKQNGKTFQLVMGSIEFIDPLVAYQVLNIKDIAECGGLRTSYAAEMFKYINPLGSDSTTIIEHIDMASIPISVDAFNQWFFNKVVKKSLTKYYLDQFIKDVLSSLVGRALSSRCFRDIPQVPLRFATNDFFLKGQVLGERNSLSWFRERIKKNPRLASQLPTLEGGQSISARLRRHHNRMTPKSTLFIYSTDSLPQMNKSGNWHTDYDEGIYHFYLGSAAGLVKNISFNREDMPGFREAKIQKEGTLGANQLRELYSVNLKLIGNTLLKNGQFIYINPSAIGAGSPSAQGSVPNLARLLGLGGYFLVTSVNHRISEAGFEVDVKALHQAVRVGQTQTVPLVTYQAPGDPQPDHPDDLPFVQFAETYHGAAMSALDLPPGDDLPSPIEARRRGEELGFTEAQHELVVEARMAARTVRSRAEDRIDGRDSRRLERDTVQEYFDSMHVYTEDENGEPIEVETGPMGHFQSGYVYDEPTGMLYDPSGNPVGPNEPPVE